MWGLVFNLAKGGVFDWIGYFFFARRMNKLK